MAAAAGAAGAAGAADELEVYIKNIPFTATAASLVAFLSTKCGHNAVIRCEIFTNQQNGRSAGRGFARFAAKSHVDLLFSLAHAGQLLFNGRSLSVNTSTRVRRKPQHCNDSLQCSRLYMGNLVGNNSTVEYLWNSAGPVTLECFFTDTPIVRLELRFSLGESEYKVQVSFSSIARVESCSISHRDRGLMFQLYYCPKVFTRKLVSDEDLVCDNPFLYSRELVEREWIRARDFTDIKALGQSVVFLVQFDGVSDFQMQQLLKRFHDYKLGDYPPLFKRVELRAGFEFAARQEVVPILAYNFGYDLPLEVEFKVNALIQYGYVSPTGINREFFRLLATNTPEFCLSALTMLSKREATCLNPVTRLQTYFSRTERRSSRRGRSLRYFGNILPEDGNIYVKRVMVTPTKAYFLGPELEVSNRVTRNFIDKIDNFLRLTFAEEDFDRLTSHALLQQGGGLVKTAVYERVMTVLRDGLQFGGKNFQFLAFSSSQLRENSVWMFADDGEVTGEEIRRWMGDFMAIQNVAKCAARMGQSFSSSTHTLDVQQYEVQRLSDIELRSLFKDYCFSDGIGKISREFAIQVASKCAKKFVPSAFQIRYGGYKGVVAVDPGSPYKLSLRPSMSKFTSSQTGLDVLSWTKYIPCYLNREIITLLSTLDVPDYAFEQMQEEVVEKLDQMLLDATSALEVLQTLYAGESHKLMVNMLTAGYSPQKEPYLSSLLQAFRTSQLMLLQTKSRILVPKGRCLMGCLDESRTLRYKQCFIQVTLAPGSSQYAPQDFEVHHNRGVTGRMTAFVVKGTVVVAKNPCLHPGDVLVLQAVDVPELHHMVNCVVFPQQGPRPHPNECSGGDLDGDLYFVSWDSLLIPRSSFPSMDYDPAQAVTLNRSVTLNDMITFFVDHMSSANLGQIANSYLALADSSKDRAKDSKCLELAKLFSIAVDFPKTGVPAVIPPTLRPRSYPDFMEKDDKPTYESERVIGRLYRSIKNHAFDGVVRLSPEAEYDGELLVRGYREHVDEANFLKGSYDEKLMGLLNRYDVTEAEIMSGSICNLSRFYKKRQGDAKDRVLLAARSLMKEARGWFDEGEETGQEVYAKASAWYHVTYDPSVRSQVPRDEQLLSFPWVVHDLLLRIKRSRQQS